MSIKNKFSIISLRNPLTPDHTHTYRGKISNKNPARGRNYELCEMHIKQTKKAFQ